MLTFTLASAEMSFAGHHSGHHWWGGAFYGTSFFFVSGPCSSGLGSSAESKLQSRDITNPAILQSSFSIEILEDEFFGIGFGVWCARDLFHWALLCACVVIFQPSLVGIVPLAQQ